MKDVIFFSRLILLLTSLLLGSSAVAATIAAGSIYSAGASITSDDGNMKLIFSGYGLSVKRIGTYNYNIWKGERNKWELITQYEAGGENCSRGEIQGFWTGTCEYKTKNIDLTVVPGASASSKGYWVMEHNGNLSLYNENHQLYKHTNTAGRSGAYIQFENDGSLKLYAPTPLVSWQSQTANGTYGASTNPSVGTMTPGTILKAKQYIHSGNNAYHLIMQEDGNFVLYDYFAGKALWNSNTRGAGNWAVMQTDGNMVVYNAANKPLWASGTAAKPSSYLSVQDDGNMVIYTPLRPTWSTKTATTSFNVSQSGSGIIASGQQLYAGNAVSSGNGTYSLIMQGDGNLVLYNVARGIALWDTKTYGTGMSGIKVKLQTDGNLIVTDGADSKALYASWTHMYPSSFGAVQDDGNFVIYSPYMGLAWGTASYATGLRASFSHAPSSYYDFCPDGAMVRNDQECPISISISPGGAECAVGYFGNVNNCVDNFVDWVGGLF